ncbi:MAG: hypothetical protein D6732_15080 [Methanobacteriota archaeon]|nr:MAG: hypothetical protein D6732_15080 [Euryarchaeota archaeon]
MKHWISFLRKHSYITMMGIVLRLLPSPLTGHPYDMGIWWTTGKLLSKGQSPYTPYDHLGQPVIMGVWMLISYLIAAHLPYSTNMFSLFMKIPLMLTDLYLPYYLLHLCKKYNVPVSCSERRFYAFIFLNPLAILITGFWGMPDLLALILALISLDRLLEEKWFLSSMLLSLAIGIKLYPAVLTVSMMIVLQWKSQSRLLPFIYGAVTTIVFLLISYLPFFILGWDQAEITGVLTSQTNRGYGTLSPFHMLILFSYYNHSLYLQQIVEFIVRNDWLGFLWAINSIFLLLIMQIIGRNLHNNVSLDVSFLFALDLMVVSYALWMAVASWVSEQNTLPWLILTLFSGILDDDRRVILISFLASVFVIGFAVYNLPFFRFFYMTFKPIIIYSLNLPLVTQRNYFLSLYGSAYYIMMLMLLVLHIRKLRLMVIYWKKVI